MHSSTDALPSLGVRPRQRRPGTGLLLAGLIAFGAVMVSYLAYKYSHPYSWTMDPVDLRVYRTGGLIVRHVRPAYNPQGPAPLYDWPGYGGLKLQFTYPPFAALAFSLVSFIPWAQVTKAAVLANIGFLVLTLWFTYGGLGYRGRRVRLGAALLTAAAVFWTEPVMRTIYLGQVNLALMALIMWDMCQPDRRWWKGAGVGIAAGIKLVPLIFIPYLMVTRRFRQAGVACAAFAASVAAGFAVLPADSAKWWFTGLFFNGGRAGFVGWEGNQSLRALTARLVGSIAGSERAWLVVVTLTVAAGLAGAAVLDRKGHRMAGLLTCALTGLLASPISWDHHWVWIVPGIALAVRYAAAAMAAAARQQARQPRLTHWRDRVVQVHVWASSRLAWKYGALAAAMLVVFGAWPGGLWGRPRDLGDFSLGVLWAAPGTSMATYEKLGDRRWYAEYHWHGLQLIAGNAYVLCGLALLGILLAAAYLAPGPDRLAPADPARQPADLAATS